MYLGHVVVKREWGLVSLSFVRVAMHYGSHLPYFDPEGQVRLFRQDNYSPSTRDPGCSALLLLSAAARMVDGGAPPPPLGSPGGSGSDTRQLYNLWFVGVLAYVVGATCQALGANLQRLSAQQEGPEKGTERTPRALLHGHVGLTLFALGGIVCSLALLFASEALVAPLVVLLFIINPIFAYQLNGEPFRLATDGVCTAFIMVGIGLVVGFEPHESDSYSIAHMAWLFQQSTFIGFVTVVVGLLGITWWGRRYVQRRETIADLSRHLVQLSHGGLAGGFGGLNITLTKAIFTLITGQYDEGSRVLGGGYEIGRAHV